MGPSKALIAWVFVVAVAMVVPTASARADFTLSYQTGADDEAGVDAASIGRERALAADVGLALRDLPSLDGFTASALSCAPVVHLERSWYGGVVTEEREQDQQLLLPVGVMGEVTKLVPGALGILRPVVKTVYDTVDVAVLARWDEEFVDWGTYTDRLSVGLGAADAPSLSALDAEGWQVNSLEVGCGDASQRTGLERDPRSDEVQYFCLACTTLPTDGWYLRDILDIQVYIAEARDYAELPTRATLPACPDEVAAAVQDRIAALAPTLQDAVLQKAQRALAQAANV